MKQLKSFKANARSVIDGFILAWASKFHFLSFFSLMPSRSAATAELPSLIAFAASSYLYRQTCFPPKGSETVKKTQIKAWWGTQMSFTEEQEAVRRLSVYAGFLNAASPPRPASICSALDKLLCILTCAWGVRKTHCIASHCVHCLVQSISKGLTTQQTLRKTSD